MVVKPRAPIPTTSITGTKVYPFSFVVFVIFELVPTVGDEIEARPAEQWLSSLDHNCSNYYDYNPCSST